MKKTKIVVEEMKFNRFKGDVLMLGIFKDTKDVPQTDKSITDFLKLGDFSGKTCENATLYLPGNQRVMLVGLGEKAKFEPNVLRETFGAAVRAADKLSVKKIGIALPADLQDEELVAQAVSEGVITGRYDFDEYLTEKKEDKKPSSDVQIVLIASNSPERKKFDNGCKIGLALAEGQNLARAISNQPANEINPPTLAREAMRLAKEAGISCKIFDEKKLTQMKMNAILAVGNGSASKPRLIMLEYGNRKSAPDVVLVGKAITFDSGGIDLKPAPKMELMKFDKSGGCAVLGIMAAVARLKLPLHIVALVPAAENLLSSTAWRPGDIVRTYSGKTVEILSTDAEGRMVLCDAMSYAVKMKPAAIVDLATLTGACAVALGEHYAGLFGNNDAMLDKFKTAANVSGERVWHMPSGQEYLEQMKSKNADLKNVGMREGGACAAAAFLGDFVNGIPWVHLDIACVAKPDTDKPWRDSGATGFGVRLVLEYLRAL